MSKWGRKQRPPPPGFEYIEPTLTALDNELREKVNEPHEGKRKTESQWPVHQINWQKSRYVYDMYYIYHRISREVYDYCIEQKLVDAALIAKWKKPGYEKLCSTYVINPKNYKFGGVSICRVPKQNLAPGTIVEDPVTGCRGCASGAGGERNIFGNKYGQYLAGIQIARERRLEQQRLQKQREQQEQDEEESDEEKEEKQASDETPYGLEPPKASIWADEEEERELELPEDVLADSTSAAAAREARAALEAYNSGAEAAGKRQRT